jgi:hypothetical protein
MKVYDNFQEVMLFSTTDTFLLRALFNMIWKHNLDEDHEVFMVFMPRLMDKSAAALKLQQSFRSYMKRKRQRELGYSLICPVNEYFMAQAVIQTRAANCISQWWKAFNL